jgi:hypothetical protein
LAPPMPSATRQSRALPPRSLIVPVKIEVVKN